MQETYDIVIVGAGPVGLMLSACLGRMGKYRIKQIDSREEPIKTGRAAGIQARNLDLLKSMGLKRKIMINDPFRVHEAAFWQPSVDTESISRVGSWKSLPSFIDTRHPFSTILNQGHTERILLEDLHEKGYTIDRPWTISDFENDGKDQDYPVRVSLLDLKENKTYNVRTKYLFGADGARSLVREKLGIQMVYKDPIAHVWSVMDGIVKTDFPDIKMKCTVQSKKGSALVIPQTDKIVRIYIQIVSFDGEEWDSAKTMKASDVQQLANEIFAPYFLEWEHVDWFSIYPIGQGISQRYTLDERVFMGGDACHTHSPKAGQGMNTGWLDAHNFAWKMHLVESGFGKRSLLSTYEEERRTMAQRLVNFDARYAKLFSTQPPPASKTNGVANSSNKDNTASESEFVRMHKESSEFTSGYGVLYPPNILNITPSSTTKSPHFNPKGATLVPGRIFPPSTVTRVSNARPAYLEQDIPLDGSFRIYIFAGKYSVTTNALSSLASGLEASTSFLSRCLRPDLSNLSHHECRHPHSLFFTIATIFNAIRVDIEISHLPKVLAAYKDCVYADDVWDSRVPNAKAAAHVKMGFDEEKGGVVVVRPDAHIGCVVELVEGPGTTDALSEYFDGIMAEAKSEPHVVKDGFTNGTNGVVTTGVNGIKTNGMNGVKTNGFH